MTVIPTRHWVDPKGGRARLDYYLGSLVNDATPNNPTVHQRRIYFDYNRGVAFQVNSEGDECKRGSIAPPMRLHCFAELDKGYWTVHNSRHHTLLLQTSDQRVSRVFSNWDLDWQPNDKDD